MRLPPSAEVAQSPTTPPATSPTCRRCRAGCRASRRDPRAGSGRRWPAGTSTSMASAAIRVQAEQRARQPVGRVGDGGVRAGRRPRRRGARVREVVLDLPAHPVDLLRDRGRELRSVPPPRRARPRAPAPRAASSGRARDRRPWRARGSTAASWCASSAFRSRTSGWTSAGYVAGQLPRGPALHVGEPAAHLVERREAGAHDRIARRHAQARRRA